MSKEIKLLMVLLSLLGAAQCFAAKIIVTIEDVSSVYNNAQEGPYYAEKLIGIDHDSNDVINTGLDINGPGTHSTLAANYYSAGQNGTMWMTASSDTEYYIIFDLGAIYDDLEYVKIWNFNRPDVLNWGVKDLDIYVSDVSLAYGDAGWTFATSAVLSQAPGDATTPFGDKVPLTVQNVRYVLFDIQSRLDSAEGEGPKYPTGLSEVVFWRKALNCTEVWAEGSGLAMDFNQDCYVNLLDFAEFAQVWLQCNDPTDPACE